MTELVRSVETAGDQSGRNSDDSERHQQAPAGPVPASPRVSRGAHRLRWQLVASFAGAVAGIVAIGWFIFLSRGQTGSKAEWFFGAMVFCVVMVAMWQTLDIRQRAERDAGEAAERLRTELLAAEERAARELALTQTMHRLEMEAQQQLYRAERAHLVNQLQKQSTIEVTRAVNRHTQALATLWHEGARVLHIDDRAKREQAMAPVFDQIGQIVNDFAVELANASLLIEDAGLQLALRHVNDAVLLAVRVAEDVHEDVLEKRMPQENPFPAVQRLMHTRAAEARSLAWELLRTGLGSPDVPVE